MLFPYAPTIPATVTRQVTPHFRAAFSEIDMPKPLRVGPPETSATSEVQAPRTKGRRQFRVAEKQRIRWNVEATRWPVAFQAS
jgi:hypothetical protein